MNYELIFDRVYSTGISGVVQADCALESDVISAYSLDEGGNESLLATSSMCMWRPDAIGAYPGVTQQYCGFNLPFVWRGRGSLPGSILIKVGEEVVKRFDQLADPVNSYGLSASNILTLSDRSFYGLQGMTMQSGILSIAGALTPPAGDFSQVEFVCPPGISAKFHWPIFSEDVDSYYWYVPGSPYLLFRIDVALADCSDPPLDYIEFGLKVKGQGPEYNELRNITLPLDFGALMNFPPEHNVQRVQFTQNRVGASISGASDAHRILKIASRYKQLDNPFRILDWGCGFGRVARYIRYFAPNAEVFGADIDDKNLSWMVGHMPNVRPVSSDINGYIEQSDKSIDIIFGISVMTHLPIEVMKIWLKELCRVVKDDGLLLLTVVGDGSLAFTSRWLKPEDLYTWSNNGYIVFENKNETDGDIGGEGYYVQTMINEENLREAWRDYVDVLEFIPAVFGYQDMVVCRPKT